MGGLLGKNMGLGDGSLFFREGCRTRCVASSRWERGPSVRDTDKMPLQGGREGGKCKGWGQQPDLSLWEQHQEWCCAQDALTCQIANAYPPPSLALAQTQKKANVLSVLS